MKSSFGYKAKSILLLFFMVSFFSPLCAIAATHDVTVGNNFFSPNDLTIEVGDTVRWTNNASRVHDVTADDGSFSQARAASFTFSRQFMSIEEVLYHCSVHSAAGRNRNTFQNGRINVVAAAATTDVSIESVDAIGGTHEAGEDFTVNATLKNNGGEDSGSFNVDFYASVDDGITTGDTLLGSNNISNIAAGESVNIDESVVLPESLAAGDYFIGAISDLADNNSGNNTSVDATTVFVFKVFIINAGLNDAWFNALTNGQGFFVTVFADTGVITIAWFTYDTELPDMDATANLGDPGHRWLTALGIIDGDKSEMGISITSEGLFDTPPPEEGLPRVDDGTIVLKFKNCNEGTVSYDIPSIDAQGDVPITRIVNDNVVLCEALLRESEQP